MNLTVFVFFFMVHNSVILEILSTQTYDKHPFFGGLSVSFLVFVLRVLSHKFTLFYISKSSKGLLISLIFLLLTWVYIIVVFGSACPNNS